MIHVHGDRTAVMLVASTPALRSTSPPERSALFPPVKFRIADGSKRDSRDFLLKMSAAPRVDKNGSLGMSGEKAEPVFSQLDCSVIPAMAAYPGAIL